jgi:hypothetical protein
VSVAGWLDAMRSDLPPAYRLVWQCLESHANSARFWEIRDGDIAAEIRLSKNTVGRAIAELEEQRIIRVVRRKRLPTRYHMLRSYGAKQHCGGTEPDLFSAQNEDSTAELTPQNVDSTAFRDPELTPQNVDSSGELSPQNGDSLSPTESNRKKASPPLSPKGDEKPRKVPLPKDWEPKDRHFELGSGIGLSPAQVLEAAQQMREKMAHTLERGADWDTRFAGWLRGAARLGDRQRASPKTRDYAALLRRIEAGGDEPSRVECAA